MSEYNFTNKQDIIIITFYEKLESKIIIQSLKDLYKNPIYKKSRKVLFDLSQNLSINIELKELVDIREYVINNREKDVVGYVGIQLRNKVIAGLSIILEMIMSKIDIHFKVSDTEKELLQWLEAV